MKPFCRVDARAVHARSALGSLSAQGRFAGSRDWNGGLPEHSASNPKEPRMTANHLTPAVCLFALIVCPPALAQTSTQAAVTERAIARPPEADALAALERKFWLCEHAATQYLMDLGTATHCSVVTETLKAQRFGGDFKAMLAWWQANKDAQLAQAAGSAWTVARTSKGVD
jgi:hypothetical protein